MTNEQFLEKITTVENVNSFARKKRNKYNLKSVSISEKDEYINEGWELDREYSNSMYKLFVIMMRNNRF